MSTLGVVIFNLQGMKHLAQCLESVQWADAIKVLDSGDSDGWSVTPKRIQDLSEEMTTDWVLHLWGEESVEGKLAAELRALCRRELSIAATRYRITIRSYLLGRWVEGSLWGPSPSLRLSRRVEGIPAGWWDAAKRSRDAPSLPEGWIGDYSAVELSDGLDRLNGLSTLWAGRLRVRGESPGPAAMTFYPFGVFFQLLWKNGVFSRGLAGLTISILAAYVTLLTSAKLWEKNHAKTATK